MKVVNREGERKDVSYDEIKRRILRLCTDRELQDVDIDIVIIQTINGIYDGISTYELDDLSARECATLQVVHHTYDVIAAKIFVSNIAKSVRRVLQAAGQPPCFSGKVAYLSTTLPHAYDPEFVRFVRHNAARLDAMVCYDRDATHTYFALRTLERSYLMKVNDLAIESPQDMWMRVAVALHMPRGQELEELCGGASPAVGGGDAQGGSGIIVEGSQQSVASAVSAVSALSMDDGLKAIMERIFSTYDHMSRGDYTHATPTLFNAGMRVSQCSSCFVGDTEVATVNAGVKKIQDVAIGDLVVTHKGNVRPVTQLHTNPLGDRNLHRLKVAGSKEVVVTDNHRFWAVRDGAAEPAWIKAEDLRSGDYVGMPKVVAAPTASAPVIIADMMDYLQRTEDPERYEAVTVDGVDMVWKRSGICPGPPIARYWTLDQDFAFFIGTCLTTGVPCMDLVNGSPLGFSIESHRLDQDQDYYIKIGERVFGIPHAIQPIQGQDDHLVQFASPVIATALIALCGNEDHDHGYLPRIPDLLFSQPSHIVHALLAGLYTPPDICEERVELTIDMEYPPDVGMQLYHLLRAHGIPAAFTDGGKTLHIPEVDEVNALIAKYRPHAWTLRKTHTPQHGADVDAPQVPAIDAPQVPAIDIIDIIDIHDQKFLRVESNEVRTEFDDVRPEFVYTLGVEEDHSYAVEGLLAENCYLLGTEDSLGGIFKTLSDCAQISKWAGGIGLHVTNVRAKGSTIHSTNGRSDGIIPMLKVYNETARYCNQSGRRKGSIAVYLEPWHADVWEFVELRRNTGAETERARDLFLALWVPDEFMRRVLADDVWYLMTPDVSTGLVDAIGEDFSRLYQQHIDAGRYVRKVRARELWQHVLTSQIETGTPYVCFKDHMNRKSNVRNVATIRSSNLCSEIALPSDHEHYAVCNLASIAVNRFFVPPAKGAGPSEGSIDHARLHQVAKDITFNLNRVIDINSYPTEEARRSNMALRPLGIGVQGFGDLYCLLRLPYEDERALRLDAEVMETIYHGALEASAEIAEREGAYVRFDGSAASQGQLQIDLWAQDDKSKVLLSGRYDWDAMRTRVQASGLRNSLLVALMPTASTSQILGNCESFEPFQSNVFKRSTLAGEFMVVNKHLQRELMAMDLWDEDMRKRLLAADGSVQNNPRVPPELKAVYRTVWEVPQRAVIDHAVARGPFVCQSQSMNLYMGQPTSARLSSALTYAWQKGLKTGMYYLRSTAAVEAIKYGLSAAAPSSGTGGSGSGSQAAASKGEPTTQQGQAPAKPPRGSKCDPNSDICLMCSS